MAETLNLVFEALIHQNVDVELLVAPVDFENGLETSQELISLWKGCSDYISDAVLFASEGRSIDNPAERRKG